MTNNELIARFLGIQVFKSYEEMQACPIEELFNWTIPDDPKWGNNYAKDWNKLMDVIAKIESLGYDTGICGVVIKGEKLTEVLFSPHVKNNTIEIHVRDSKPKIEVVHQAVVDFIKCYSV